MSGIRSGVVGPNEVIAVTCYTGSEELMAMTERMLCRLNLTARHVAQGVSRPATFPGAVCTPTNVGFAQGMNWAIEAAIQDYGLPEYFLVINNDVVPPEGHGWIRQLMGISRGFKCVSPVTNRTGISYAKRAKPTKSHNVTEHEIVGAFCLLVPRHVITLCRKEFGYNLFDPDFGYGYGEDDLLFAILRKYQSRKPALVAHHVWVEHLKAQTAKTIKIDRKHQTWLLHQKTAAL